MSATPTAERIPLVDLKAQYASIADEIDPAVRRVFENGDFVLGEDVTAFEHEFAAYCEVEHVVGVDSGISALELAMRALDIGLGDEVITPANSFIASSSAISFTGATPVWVDVDPTTHNIDIRAVRRAVTSRTKAIMAVHLFGQPADMDPLLEIARDHQLAVIEDAAQAHGARYKGRRVGSLGDVAAFSFYPGKNLGAYGDAGAIATNRDDLAARVRTMGNYGQRQKYDHTTLAWNRRLDTLQAAVLRVKLRHLDTWSDARRRHASRYHELLTAAGVDRPGLIPAAEHVYHLYVVESDRRDELRQFLQDRGIEASMHYPIPIHLQAAYAGRGFRRGAFPVTERLAERVISLPMFPELRDDQLVRVTDAIAEFNGRSRKAVAAGANG